MLYLQALFMENEYNPTCLRPEIDVYPMEKSSYTMYKKSYKSYGGNNAEIYRYNYRIFKKHLP